MTKNVYFNPSLILLGKSVVIESTPKSLKCLAVSMSLMVQESVVCSWLFIVVQTTLYKVFLTFGLFIIVHSCSNTFYKVFLTFGLFIIVHSCSNKLDERG